MIIMQIIASWSQVEKAAWQLLAEMISSRDPHFAMKFMIACNEREPLQRCVRLAAELEEAAIRQAFSEALALVGNLAEFRNLLAHGWYGTCPELPRHLLVQSIRDHFREHEAVQAAMVADLRRIVAIEDPEEFQKARPEAPEISMRVKALDIDSLDHLRRKVGSAVRVLWAMAHLLRGGLGLSNQSPEGSMFGRALAELRA